MAAKPGNKAECLNPNTGRKMYIDEDVYDLFSKAIYHTLKKKKGITYTDMVKGVKECLKEKKIKFKGSIEWYAVTVKNDMEANGIIQTVFEKGKKLHSLKK